MISATGTAKVVTLARTDPVFARLRAEAEEAVGKEPDIAGFLFSAILNQDSLEAAVGHRLAARLGHQAFPSDLIEQAYFEAIAADPAIPEAFRADIAAVVDRDPACHAADRACTLFQGVSRRSRRIGWRMHFGRRPPRLRPLSPEPFIRGIPDRYSSGSPDRQRHFPRSRDWSCRRRHCRDRRRLFPCCKT